MSSLPDILLGDGEHIYMRGRAFDAEWKPQPGQPALQAPGGFLDGSYFKRIAWTYGTSRKDYARLIVHDEHSAYYVRMFDTLRGLDPTVYFTPGRRGYLLFAKEAGAADNTWQTRVPVRIRAMVLAADHLLVAGPPDVVKPRDPLAAFSGRAGGVLAIFDAATGVKLVEHALPAAPVFNGAAAADGRFYLVDEQGAVSCFGRAEGSEAPERSGGLGS